MPTAEPIEKPAFEPSPRLETRRTGVVFLCLIATANFVPWMRLVSSLSLSAAQSSLAILSCLLAAMLVIGAWLLGRRLPVKPGRLTVPARDAGLALALLATAANLALAVAVQRRTPGNSFAGVLKWLGPVWYGLIVPIGLAAAFFKGRASIPALRRAGSAASVPVSRNLNA